MPDFYKTGLTKEGKPAEATTIPALKELKAHADGGVTGKLDVETHVLPSHRGDLVDKTEQDHPNGFREFLKGLSDNVLQRMVHDKTDYKSMEQFAEARKEYVHDAYIDEVTRQGLWDQAKGPHDYSLPKFHAQ